MTAQRLPGDEVDTSERLSPDDMATRRDEEFLAAALRAQQRRQAGPAAKPGTCANCQARCLPLAVYCDKDCQADHEARKRVLERQGRAV